MFSLELSSEQIRNRNGFLVVWESRGQILRVTFESAEPADTADEVVMKAI